MSGVVPNHIKQAIQSFTQQIPTNDAIKLITTGFKTDKQNFLFKHQEKKYILAFYRHDKQILSHYVPLIKELNEYEFFPQYLQINHQENYLIREYIEGDSLDNNFNPLLHLEDILAALKKIHRHKIKEKFNPGVDILKIIDQGLKIVCAVSNELFSDVFHFIKFIVAKQDKLFVKKYLCHGDCNGRNIIITHAEKVKFIDWDDAGINDPYLDLTNLYIQNFWQQINMEDYLRIYLKKAPSHNEMKKMEIFSGLALLSNAFWYLIHYQLPTAYIINNVKKPLLDYVKLPQLLKAKKFSATDYCQILLSCFFNYYQRVLSKLM